MKKAMKKAKLALVLGLAVLLAVVSEGSAAEVLKLKLATYAPVGYPAVYAGQKLWVDKVNELGKGIVHVEPYWGGTLLNAKTMIPGLQDGVADLIFHTSSYMTGSYPIIGIQCLPIWKSINDTYKAFTLGSPLYNLQNEVLKKKNLYQIGISGVVPGEIFTRGVEKIGNPGDLKGLRIRVPGVIPGKAAVALGLAPTTISSAELPVALGQGLVDGAVMNPWTSRGRRIEEFTDTWLMAPLYWETTPVYTTWENWRKWPEEVRNVMVEATKYWEVRYIVEPPLAKPVPKEYLGEYEGKEYIIVPRHELAKWYKEHGLKRVVELSEKELAEYKIAYKPVVDWWVKEVGKEIGNKALGLAGYK
jgi:TRAP-type C4-dicarboxylate transport system substrate-binding protein